MPDLKSILPFWPHHVSGEEAARDAPPIRPEKFGKASGFELHFGQLMEDAEAGRGTLFSPRSCR